MLDIKLLRENPEVVKENIKKKFQDHKLPLVDEVIELDKNYRAAKTKADEMRAQRNAASKEIGMLMKTGQRDKAEMVELEKNRKAILRKAKEDAEHLLQESNAKIENTIRTIKEAQAEKEKTRLARQELSDFKGQINDINKQNEKDKIAQKMQKLREKQERKKDKKNQPQAAANAPKPIEPKAKPIEKGSIVKIKGQTGVGQVLDISGKTAIVSFGMIKTNVKIDRLEVTDAPIQKANAVSSFVSSKTQDHVYEKKLEFKQDIDVRGMRGDEAIQAVTYFIDDAILLGISRVRILHGTGNGILRTLIRNYLSGVPGVAHFQDEHVQFGGAGITVVDLD